MEVTLQGQSDSGTEIVNVFKKELELAWAAGFFDGEGCFSYSTRNYRIYPRLFLGQNAHEDVFGVDIPDTLERFWYAVGKLGSIDGPYKGTNATTKFHFQHRAFGKEVHSIYKLLEPYLSSYKKEQYLRMCRRCGERP